MSKFSTSVSITVEADDDRDAAEKFYLLTHGGDITGEVAIQPWDGGRSDITDVADDGRLAAP